MTSRTVSTLKFVGSISLGLLTGVSYTLSTLTLPTILTLPTATSASQAFTSLTSISLLHLRALAVISSSSFILSYILSQRSQRHPYLLWICLFVGGSQLAETLMPKKLPAPRAIPTPRTRKTKTRHMDSSYEVLGHDTNSEATLSGEEGEDEVNGEEVRKQMEGFMANQIVRTVVTGLGFAISIIGIWGDGAAEMVIIEM
ncbi:hypothetical protein BJ878DRAFT_515876 [Calycina marina]|uniref:Uncharacterized protein n=1 Tax=Calycina marina TaxID=1763456 RepID=A0A9P8CCV6_9HELO|nr:hypothetical protein BJ878DRAFT_515876 [Calycina marina]